MDLGAVVGRARWRISVGLALALMGCSREELVHGLTEFEANEIVYVLETGGLTADKEREEGGRVVVYKVSVPRGDANKGRKLLVDNQLPRPKPITLERVYDPANKGLIPTATEEEAGFQMAIQGEIAQKIKTIPGVVEAHVTIVKPKRDIVRDLNEKPPPATAAITVLYNPIDGKMPFKVDDIQRLVAGSVEGLDAQNVTVVPSLNRGAIKKISGMAGGEETQATDGEPRPAGVKFLGIGLAEESDKEKLKKAGMVAGGAVGILAAVVFLLFMAFVSKSRRLTEANAKLMSMKVARKTQDGSTPP